MYGKCFSSLWRGSMRGQADLQLVFIYLFSHADSEGFVEMIPEAIADDCGLSTDRVAEALRQLCESDPRSRSPEQGGARLEPIDERGWGWQIVNYKYYRSLQDQETVRAGNRKRKQKQRGKLVTESHGASRQEEVEGEEEADRTKPLSANADFLVLWNAYPHYGARSRKSDSLLRWKKIKPTPSMEEVLRGLAACRTSEDWVRESGRFVPGLQTWIIARGWDCSIGGAVPATKTSRVREASTLDVYLKSKRGVQ
jgi:hypothetical protein